jgi:hypothetical protein
VAVSRVSVGGNSGTGSAEVLALQGGRRSTAPSTDTERRTGAIMAVGAGAGMGARLLEAPSVRPARQKVSPPAIPPSRSFECPELALVEEPVRDEPRPCAANDMRADGVRNLAGTYRAIVP